MGDGSGHISVHGSTTQSRNHEAPEVKLEAVGSHVTVLLHVPAVLLGNKDTTIVCSLRSKTSVPDWRC